MVGFCARVLSWVFLISPGDAGSLVCHVFPPGSDRYHSESADGRSNRSKEDDEEDCQDHTDRNGDQEGPPMHATCLGQYGIDVSRRPGCPDLKDSPSDMAVVQIVTNTTGQDMHDDIYTRKAEDDEGDHCLNVHLPIQHPDESKSET